MTHIGFELNPTTENPEKRTTEINGRVFEIRHLKNNNLWEIFEPGVPGAKPKELQGFYTSHQEAYKAASTFMALQSVKKKNDRSLDNNGS